MLIALYLALFGGGAGPAFTVDMFLAETKTAVIQIVEDVDRERETQRKLRRRQFRVGIVGYTNAGKSTLFNSLTGSSVQTEDRLFATLDATTRKLSEGRGYKAGNRTVLVTDTVGFIRHLPHELVAAFRSTLQEASEADLLLHVIDANAEDRDDTIYQVNQVLEDIDAHEIPQLQVF